MQLKESKVRVGNDVKVFFKFRKGRYESAWIEITTQNNGIWMLDDQASMVSAIFNFMNDDKEYHKYEKNDLYSKDIIVISKIKFVANDVEFQVCLDDE